MPGQSSEDIALPTLSVPKERDYAPYLERNKSAPATPSHHEVSEDDRGEYSDTVSSDTTATNSSDEFNWDEEDEEINSALETKAKRGRAVYLMFMQLARPFRVILIGLIGAAVFVAPLLVVQLKFKNSPISRQVLAWSLWLSITWAATCITYLLVDAVPRLIIYTIILFGGHVEQLKTQLEVCVISRCVSKLVLIYYMWLVKYSYILL